MDNNKKAYIMSLKFAVNAIEYDYNEEDFVDMITNHYKSIMFDERGNVLIPFEDLIASIILFSYHYQRYFEGFYERGIEIYDIGNINGKEDFIDMEDFKVWTEGYTKYILDNGHDPKIMDSYKERLVWCYKYIINNLEEV